MELQETEKLKPYPTLLRKVFLPMASAIKGMMVVSCLKELERTEWYSREEIMRLQAKKLRALVDHAYRNVPYYRRAFTRSGIEPSDIRNQSDIAKLPVLEKDDVRNNLSDMVARNRPFGKLHLMSTSGSTGRPLRFYQDNRAQSYAYASNIRNNSRMGLKYGEKYVRFTGLQQQLLGAGVHAPIYDMVHNLVTRRVGSFPSYGINEHALLQYAQRIRKSKPKCIIGHASALYLMAAFMQERGISDLTVDAIMSVSEQLWRRETIEEAFHSRVFDDYSSREFSIAAECEMHRGYHIASEIVLLEFVRNNENVSSGELGEILVTDLTNWGMPFIRYRIGDLGRPTDDFCPCGRGLPMLERIEGRSMDYITSSDGRIHSGGNITMIFKDLPVRQFHVHQLDYAKVSIQLVVAPGYTAKHSEEIVCGMRRMMGSDTSVEILLKDKLDAGPSGKRRFIVSDVSTTLFGGKRITRDSSS
jgi:phenylacetate-CoA ligase